MTSGAGAWTVPPVYSRRMVIPPDVYSAQRIRCAVRGMQVELIEQRFLDRPNYALDGVFGPKTEAAVARFQKSTGIDPAKYIEGEIGPGTARRMFSPVVAWWQAALVIPENILFGLIRLESGFDPGAEGKVDPADRGIAQWNRRYHPDVTDELAFGDPRFCIERAARHLADAHSRLGVVSWDAAIAAHNSPAKAKIWADTGSAPDAQIRRYVDLVRTQAAKPI